MTRHTNSEAVRASFAPDVPIDRMGRIDRPFPETWGPPPLHPFLFEEQQTTLLTNVETLTRSSVPEHMPHPISAQIVDTAGTRFVGRMVANYDNLATAERLDTPLTDIQREMVDRALAGVANPAELMYVSDTLGMRGIALGTVSHPFGERVEFLIPMREAIDESIRVFGGEPTIPEVKKLLTTYAVKAAYVDHGFNDGRAHSLLMTRKVPLGSFVRESRDVYKRTDRVDIKERSSFLVRIDQESPVPIDMKIGLASRLNDGTHDDKDRTIESGTRLHDYVTSLLEGNEFETAIPLSTTSYKFDDGVDKPERPQFNVGKLDPRKLSPNLAMEVTKSKMRLANIPLNFSEARKLPLADLIPPRMIDVD